jgi:hypothetical protein
VAEKKTPQTYEELAHRLAEDPAHPLPAPVDVRTGESAAAYGREFLLREFGDEQAIQAAMRKPGRPRKSASDAGARKGASPTVRGRVAAADYDMLARIEAKTGKTESELVREGVALVIARYA